MQLGKSFQVPYPERFSRYWGRRAAPWRPETCLVWPRYCWKCFSQFWKSVSHKNPDFWLLLKIWGSGNKRACFFQNSWPELRNGCLPSVGCAFCPSSTEAPPASPSSLHGQPCRYEWTPFLRGGGQLRPPSVGTCVTGPGASLLLPDSHTWCLSGFPTPHYCPDTDFCPLKLQDAQLSKSKHL